MLDVDDASVDYVESVLQKCRRDWLNDSLHVYPSSTGINYLCSYFYASNYFEKYVFLVEVS